MDDNKAFVERLAAETAKLGGRAYYVGGYVRDYLLGITQTDIDVEIHGIAPTVLEMMLASFGEVMKLGASFGIFAVRGYSVDIALPRTERAVGVGHRDFEVGFDPYIGTMQAAMRRDFTVNAMMMDVLSGEIVDHFGGRADLEARTIRHVNDEAYVEDPLRVLRAAQFAARFGFTVAPETAKLNSSVDLSHLARERVIGECDKAMMKADTPSVFFRELKREGQLGVWFPELAMLDGVRQNPTYHPEGDAFEHTMRVVDAAASLRDKAENPREYMYSALCHDLGKAVTTTVEDGRIRSLGHEKAGVAIAEAMLRRLTDEAKLIKYVTNMTALHMKPNKLASEHSGDKAFANMFYESVCPIDLLLLAKADRIGQMRTDGCEADEALLRAKLAYYNELMAKPYVKGEDLVRAGFTPSPAFGDAIDYATKLRLSDVPFDDALKQTVAYLNKAIKKRT